jgi:hypothetical protein
MEDRSSSEKIARRVIKEVDVAAVAHVVVHAVAHVEDMVVVVVHLSSNKLNNNNNNHVRDLKENPVLLVRKLPALQPRTPVNKYSSTIYHLIPNSKILWTPSFK